MGQRWFPPKSGICISLFSLCFPLGWAPRIWWHKLPAAPGCLTFLPNFSRKSSPCYFPQESGSAAYWLRMGHVLVAAPITIARAVKRPGESWVEGQLLNEGQHHPNCRWRWDDAVTQGGKDARLHTGQGLPSLAWLPLPSILPARVFPWTHGCLVGSTDVHLLPQYLWQLLGLSFSFSWCCLFLRLTGALWGGIHTITPHRTHMCCIKFLIVHRCTEAWANHLLFWGHFPRLYLKKPGVAILLGCDSSFLCSCAGGIPQNPLYSGIQGAYTTT